MNNEYFKNVHTLVDKVEKIATAKEFNLTELSFAITDVLHGLIHGVLFAGTDVSVCLLSKSCIQAFEVYPETCGICNPSYEYEEETCDES